jgi:hypothetical protein
MVGKRGTPAERFDRFYIPEPNSGCWLWTGVVDNKNYGQFYFPPRNMVHAHRAAWILFRGDTGILQVLHHCDNTFCVNPDHLYLGTVQDNMRDRDLRKRRAPPIGCKNGRALLTEEQVRAIRADKRWPRFVAKDFDVSVSTINMIRSRQTWKHI